MPPKSTRTPGSGVRTYITIILLRMSLKKTATEETSLVTFVADKLKHLEHQKYF